MAAADPARAAVTDLSVSESGANAVLSWSTGTGPFRVLRSTSPAFLSSNALLGTVASGPFTDVGAVAPNTHSYFYTVVSVGDGQNNPPGFDLNPPRPVPFLTLLTPNVGVPGDTVVIDGGNFAEDGSGMTVTFGPEIAEVTATAATQLTVVVPPDAVTGEVQVCVADACSNHLLFKVTVGPVFRDISSLAFEESTGSLWVGDRGDGASGGDRVYEIDAAGTTTARATLAQTVVSAVFPAYGRIYYCNSTVISGNQGSISWVNVATNTTTFFRAAGTGTTDPVYCRGLAPNFDAGLGQHIVYFIDGNLERVRKVYEFALVVDKDYGDVGAGFFSFNDPAGARLDAAGNLYVSSTTTIYKITPSEQVSIVATGFGAAAGMDLTEVSGFPLLLVADEGTGEVVLVQADTGLKTVVGSGFSGPVAAVFSSNPTTGALYYDVAEPTRIYRLPDPRIVFTEPKDTIVLLSKKPGVEDTYPSLNQTADAQIKVELEAVGCGPAPAGQTVYLRLIDPKDPSGYLSGSKNDNKPASPAGAINPTVVTTNASGLASTVLTVNPPYSGNNYEIEASCQPPPNFKRIGTSRLYTSWKRAYIEDDRMYKAGAFVSSDSGAGTADPHKVFVSDTTPFAPSDPVHVFSGFNSSDSPSVRQAANDGETGVVQSVNSGGGYITLVDPLVRTYADSFTPAAVDQYPYSFVGAVGAGVFDSTPCSTPLGLAYNDTYTEWICLGQGPGFVPYWEHVGGNPNVDPDPGGVFIDQRSFAFFANTDSSGQPLRNHVQVVSASRHEQAQPAAGSLGGVTSADNVGGATATNWSWIYLDTINALYPPNVLDATAFVVAHELGHQWNVNPGAVGGHDTLNAWKPPGQVCLMNATAQAVGVVRMHKQVTPSIDLLCLRGHTDDLNVDDCTWP